MDSIERLIGYYNKSDEEDMYHKIVGRILKNIHKIEDATIYDLADMCYPSPSTISRLMKKLEFENYTDFKAKMHYALKNYRYLNRNTRDVEIQEDCDILPLYFNFLLNNIKGLRESIDYSQIEKISRKLNEAERVVFFSCPEVQIDILQKCMIISGKESDFYDNIVGQERGLERVEEGTLVFAIVPNLMEMSPMRSVLKRARAQGAYIITICSEKPNDYMKYSDIQISFDGTKTSMDLYLFMILTNLIKYDYSHRYVDDLIEELYD